MKHKIKDERIELSKLEGYKYGFQFIAFLLIISIIDKSLIAHQSIITYKTELMCLLLMVIMIIIRNIKLDNYTFIKNKKWAISGTAFIASILSTMIMATTNYQQYSQHYTSMLDKHFLAAVLMMLLCQWCIFYFIIRIQVFKRIN